MRDMWNVAFQNSWFGPSVVPNVYVSPPAEELPSCREAYNDGPMDGPLEASMHAQWFSQMPVVNPAPSCLLGSRMGNEKPVFCRPGYVPVQTGVPGQSRCVPYSAPSGMITGETLRTFPVRPFFGFQEF